MLAWIFKIMLDTGVKTPINNLRNKSNDNVKSIFHWSKGAWQFWRKDVFMIGNRRVCFKSLKFVIPARCYHLSTKKNFFLINVKVTSYFKIWISVKEKFFTRKLCQNLFNSNFYINFFMLSARFNKSVAFT